MIIYVGGFFFIYAVLFFVVARSVMKAQMEQKQANEKKLSTISQMTTSEEQDEIERKIRKHMEKTKESPPVQNYEYFTQNVFTQDVETYHNQLDECKTEDCDVTANAKGMTVKEHCDVPNCDVEEKKPAPAMKPVKSVIKMKKGNLPLAYQLAIAETILYRGGRIKRSI